MSFKIVCGKDSVLLSFESDIDNDEFIYANNCLFDDSNFVYFD